MPAPRRDEGACKNVKPSCERLRREDTSSHRCDIGIDAIILILEPVNHRARWREAWYHGARAWGSIGQEGGRALLVAKAYLDVATALAERKALSASAAILAGIDGAASHDSLFEPAGRLGQRRQAAAVKLRLKQRIEIHSRRHHRIASALRPRVGASGALVEQAICA